MIFRSRGFSRQLKNPKFGSFIIPSGTVGTPVSLTPPTSNSSGGWSFSSLNTAIATVSGTVVTPISGGVVSIKATQAAVPASYFRSASVTSSFTVGVTVKTYATWGTTSNGNIYLSGGNLLAKRNTVTNPTASVMANMGKSSGKWYWEITKSNAGAATHQWVGAVIGGCNGTLRTDYSLGSDANGFAWYTASAYQYFKNNNVLSGAMGTLADGATVGCALDMDSKTITFYVGSGVVLGSITGLTGTTIYPAVGLYYINEGVLANFGQSAFKFTVPAGYNSGLYST